MFYPPLYTREVWHCKDVNTNIIRCGVTNFNWEGAFISTDINQKVERFSKTILDIASNFSMHETINLLGWLMK